MIYTKCDKCGTEVKTQEEFKEKLSNGEWFIGKEKGEPYYDYLHKCPKKTK